VLSRSLRLGSLCREAAASLGFNLGSIPYAIFPEPLPASRHRPSLSYESEQPIANKNRMQKSIVTRAEKKSFVFSNKGQVNRHKITDPRCRFSLVFAKY
jgi:hypothetical protein